ncbi:hypothetical protein GCM10007389_39930 [Pontibacter akesuensis]|nr:hypothetical protein GCM10007389_39930 [Pontibacter akesuensis]
MVVKALLVAVLALVIGCAVYAVTAAYRERRRLIESLRQNRRSRKEDYYPGTPE